MGIKLSAIKPLVKKYLRSLTTFPVGESKIPGRLSVINLASNENAVAPSENIINIIYSSLNTINRYASSNCEEIITAIAKFYNFSESNLLCGDGSAELINLLIDAFISPLDEVLVLKHGYLLYQETTFRKGGKIIRPDSNKFIDINALIKAITKKTKLIIIDNPNNPTGGYINQFQLEKLCNEVPKDILLIIDEAYAEYVMAHDYMSCAQFIPKSENVCMLRTFSKIYGLAGARIGWMYGPKEIVEVIRALQQPAAVSKLSQLAAIAAIKDQDRVKKIRTENYRIKNLFVTALKEMKVRYYPSEANFILLDFAYGNIADNVYMGLKKLGIIVRPMKAYHLNSCLRITIGTFEEMIALQNALFKLIISEKLLVD